MKNILILFTAIFILNCQGSPYQYFQGTFEEAKLIADSKLIFIKFYTNTWASCIRLDVETLRNPAVQEFSNQNFISLKYNANDEIGFQLYKKYNCKYVPHLLFVNSKGDEVDRIIGYLPPTEYLLRLKDIANNKNTLNDLLSQYESREVSEHLLASIAITYLW